MRFVGVNAMGIRTPIIAAGDHLPQIVCDSVLNVYDKMNLEIKPNDVIGVTEAVVAKAQGNYASIDDISTDIKQKFNNEAVGVVFPILSRNRFINILKGIAGGTKKVYILLKYPQDEVGNPIMDMERYDEYSAHLQGLMSEKQFKDVIGDFVHPFTQMDYISLYKEVSPNIEIYFSNDPRDILKLTDNVLVAEIHERNRTKKRLLNVGAKTVYMLSDILNTSINGSGYNPDYGVLGSNLSKNDYIKLFPRDCKAFVYEVQKMIFDKTGINVHVLVYGDGAFKDPFAGIWELADPVVSPGFTDGLVGTPNEIKLKYIADNDFSHLSGEEKKKAISDFIETKQKQNMHSEGTTPRKYTDLIGSLCDLMSGSGDKGTPVVLIKGYFDDFSME